MKVELKKVYTCNYCKKYSINAGALSQHEKVCGNNPNNAHKCFEFCRYLVKEVISPNSRIRGIYNAPRVTFKCTNGNCEFSRINGLYSYKVERPYYKKDFARFVSGLIRMPLECEYHEYQDNYNEEQ